jgi:hypothetical protein
MEFRSFGSEHIGGLYNLQARTGLEEYEIMHHQVGVIKSQFDLFVRQNMKRLRVEMQPGFHSEREFPYLDFT